MNGSGCWKWCNNYHFASEEQIFSLNETFSTPLLEQYINDKGGFWFHSPEILIFSCPIFCPNNWCQMFFQLLFCVVVIPEFQQECTDWHISFGSTFLARWARTLSFHVIFCYAHDWKITAEKNFPTHFVHSQSLLKLLLPFFGVVSAIFCETLSKSGKMGYRLAST